MCRRCYRALCCYTGRKRCWSKAVLGLCIGAVVIEVLGCVLPFWICGIDFCFGLFVYCLDIRNRYRCFDLGTAGDCEEAARTQMLLGLLLGFGAVFVQLKLILDRNAEIYLRLVAFLLPFIAFSFTLSGATIFVNTSMETDPSSRVCSSYFVTLFGGLLFLLSGTGQILEIMFISR